MNREACPAAVTGVAKSCTQLSDWTELNWKLLAGNMEGIEAGGEGDDRGPDGRKISLTQDVSLSQLQEMAKGRGVWHAAAHGVTKSRT